MIYQILILIPTYSRIHMGNSAYGRYIHVIIRFKRTGTDFVNRIAESRR